MPARDYYLPQRRLVNQTDASLVASPRVPRSKFIGSWTRKTAFDAGYLVPIMVDEILPGDHMSYDVTAYVRMATPVFPIFDQQRIDTHFFFVASRLLWSNWDSLMGDVDVGDNPDNYSVPQIVLDDGDITIGSIYDHFGLPTEGQLTPGQTISVNALPLRAYNETYNQWFRDQNLQADAPLHDDNGPDPAADYEILRRGKFHDYFTSALPFPQKFDSPIIPLGGFSPVTGIGYQTAAADVAGQNWNITEGVDNFPHAQAFDTAGPAIPRLGIETDVAGGLPQIFAKLSVGGQINIADFREAILIQELLERDARGGTRYIETIKSHFDVNSPDARIFRPEYIGGGTSPLIITPIAQTAQDATDPLGTLGGAGTSAGQHRASYAATEHGYIIGLISVRSELSYQQGLHRLWTRTAKEDFYWPTLAGLSEQAILRQEIYCTGAAANDDAIWGYQERFQEYRTRLSEVTGIMRSAAAGSLDAWHLAQDFSPAPALNAAFIEDNPPMDRVLAAGALAQGQQYLADILYRRTAVRPIPTYGIPASLKQF